MLELLQITNDPALARRCDALPGMRLFVDLETHGKAKRQAGRNTFISTHCLADVARVKAQLQRTRLMVRVNPLHTGSAVEVDAVLARGADLLMLPMFEAPDELGAFSRLVAGRVPVVALLETAGALNSVDNWIDTPGLCEVFVGLNDLHLSLGCRFMFEPLADGLLDAVAQRVHAQGLRFGFGGIARLDEGLLPGLDVLAEHVRLGSQAVILSRTFHRRAEEHAAGATRIANTLNAVDAVDAEDAVDAANTIEHEITALREAQIQLAQRNHAQVQADRQRIAATIRRIAQGMATPARAQA